MMLDWQAKSMAISLMLALATSTVNSHSLASDHEKMPQDISEKKAVAPHHTINIRGGVRQSGNGQNAVGGDITQVVGKTYDSTVRTPRSPAASSSIHIEEDVNQTGNGQNAVGGSITQITEDHASERLLDRVLRFVENNPLIAAAAGAFTVIVLVLKNYYGLVPVLHKGKEKPKGG